MAMGGVVLARGGPGSDGANVAYRAVPAPANRVSGFALPIGLIPLLQDPPTFDTKDSSFDAFRLANLLEHPPWNYPLTKPSEPEGDITLSVARNSLTVDLGNVRDVIPKDDLRFASSSRAPAIVVGVGHAFVGLSPLVQFQNETTLNPALRHALRDAQPFLPNTEYGVNDDVRGQAAAQALFGWAQPLVHAEKGAGDGRDGVYVGARLKLLRGLAYGSADNAVRFTTPDTLFGSVPLDASYVGHLRTAMPGDGKWGHGFDLGVVFVTGTLELGLAANDLNTHIAWNVKESVVAKDSVSGNYVQTTVHESTPYTSQVPAGYLLTASEQLGGVLVAGDAQRDAFDQVSGHAGAELWLGMWALRGGMSLDVQHELQVAGGVGLRLGRFGIDVAVATNQNNLTRERAVDLGAGLSFYH